MYGFSGIENLLSDGCVVGANGQKGQKGELGGPPGKYDMQQRQEISCCFYVYSYKLTTYFVLYFNIRRERRQWRDRVAWFPRSTR